MSTTAYYYVDLGASAITGTAAQTVFGAAPPDITDTDISDEWQITHLSTYVNHTGDPTQFHLDLFVDAVPVHRTTFSSIGSSAEVRALHAVWDITPTSNTEALIFCTATLSGSGEVGPNSRQRSTMAATQPFDVTGATIDIEVTLSSNDPTHVLTPVRTRIHKVEPVLSSGAGGGGDVISVNGKNGVVLLDAGDVGAVPDTFLGMPQLKYDGANYPARPATPDPDDAVLYTGPVDPSAAGADFVPGTDFWWQTAS